MNQKEWLSRYLNRIIILCFTEHTQEGRRERVRWNILERFSRRDSKSFFRLLHVCRQSFQKQSTIK